MEYTKCCVNPNLLENYIEENNYKQQCSVYCCLPLYFSKCVFDLRFLRNSRYYAQTLYCGLKNNIN